MDIRRGYISFRGTFPDIADQKLSDDSVVFAAGGADGTRTGESRWDACHYFQSVLVTAIDADDADVCRCVDNTKTIVVSAVVGAVVLIAVIFVFQFVRQVSYLSCALQPFYTARRDATRPSRQICFVGRVNRRDNTTTSCLFAIINASIVG